MRIIVSTGGSSSVVFTFLNFVLILLVWMENDNSGSQVDAFAVPQPPISRSLSNSGLAAGQLSLTGSKWLQGSVSPTQHQSSVQYRMPPLQAALQATLYAHSDGSAGKRAIPPPPPPQHAVHDSDTKSDVGALTFNLAKSIIGSGILSLPSGLALFSDSTTALYPGIAAILFMGLLSGYGFSSIGKACSIHSADNFNAAWIASTGNESKKGSGFVSYVIAFKTLIGCLCYSMIIGELAALVFLTFVLLC
jgi:hypothetical protein